MIRSKIRFTGIFGWSFAVFLWAAVCFVRVSVQPDRFQSVDGSFYLQLAQKWLNQEPMVLDNQLNDKGHSFSPYPPGYPMLYGISVKVFGQMASFPYLILHVVLVWLLGLFFLYSGFSFWPLLMALGIDSSLDLACYPWSEFSFMLLLAAFGLALSTFVYPQKSFPILSFALCVVLAVAAFFVRYAGFFLIGFLALIFMIWPLDPKRRQALLFTALGFIGIVLFWFYSQFKQTGFFTGGPRYPNSEGSVTLAWQLMRSVFDQILPFRDFSGSSSGSFLLGMFGFSLLVCWVFYRKLHHTGPYAKEPHHLPLGRMYVYLGLAYLAFIVPIRWYYYFAEPFDFRLLGPGFFLIWLAVFFRLESTFEAKNKLLFRLAWFLLALIFALPWKSMGWVPNHFQA